MCYTCIGTTTLAQLMKSLNVLAHLDGGTAELHCKRVLCHSCKTQMASSMSYKAACFNETSIGRVSSLGLDHESIESAASISGFGVPLCKR